LRAKPSFTVRGALGQLAFGILVLVAFVWFIQVRRVPSNLVAVRDCENRYAEARTQADTALVDLRELVFQDPAKKGVIETCGVLRKSGRL
jgi:hypothetical protein